MKATTIKSPPSVVQNPLECPECGKHTITELSPKLYQCINCNFKRDLAYKPKKKEDNSMPIVAIIGTILLMLVL